MAAEASDCVRRLTLGTTKDCAPTSPVEMEKLIGVFAGGLSPGNGLCKATNPAGTVFEAPLPIEPRLYPAVRMA